MYMSLWPCVIPIAVFDYGSFIVVIDTQCVSGVVFRVQQWLPRKLIVTSIAKPTNNTTNCIKHLSPFEVGIAWSSSQLCWYKHVD